MSVQSTGKRLRFMSDGGLQRLQCSTVGLCSHVVNCSLVSSQLYITVVSSC